MITLEQVRQLEARVKRAVGMIERLRSENSVLKERLEKSDQRLKELESLVDGFRNDQDQIEEGIRDILSQLNALEDDIHPEQPRPAESEAEARADELVTQPKAGQEQKPAVPEDNPFTGHDQEEVQEEEEPPGQLDIF